MTEPRSAREITLDAIREIYAQSREPVSRDALVNITGLPKSTVDWHLRVMIDEREDIVRCGAGGYMPVHKHRPNRIMSITPTGYGVIKIDMGDDVITLTPGELRELVPLLIGCAGLPR